MQVFNRMNFYLVRDFPVKTSVNFLGRSGEW